MELLFSTFEKISSQHDQLVGANCELEHAQRFLLKDVPPTELAEGVRRIAAGDSLLAPTVTRRKRSPTT
jgi:DNA-binding NarL/FixJ family response regulator